MVPGGGGAGTVEGVAHATKSPRSLVMRTRRQCCDMCPGFASGNQFDAKVIKESGQGIGDITDQRKPTERLQLAIGALHCYSDCNVVFAAGQCVPYWFAQPPRQDVAMLLVLNF